MSFAVDVEFVLGYYQGRDRSGDPELYPSPLRLFSAFVDAAHGVSADGTVQRTHREALSWLEGRPPQAVALPEARPSWEEPATAYREKGLITKNVSTHQQLRAGRKNGETASRIAAYSGPIIYWWRDEPSRDILRALDDLAVEIPYLGERPAATLVRVRPDAPEPLGALRIMQGLPLAGEGTRTLETAGKHRLLALERAHAALYPLKAPSVSKDGYRTSESENLAPWVDVGIDSAVYEEPAPALPGAPWPVGYVVDVVPTISGRKPRQPASRGERRRAMPSHNGAQWLPRPEDYVAWAVALHHALVKLIGWDVPPLVTGHYEDAMPGAAKPRIPANRLAVQILPASSPLASGPLEHPEFLVMLPEHADARDRARIEGALADLHHLYTRGGSLDVRSITPVGMTELWSAPAPGMDRWWCPSPLVICETRPERGKRSGEGWSISDALALAVAFVWREEFVPDDRRGVARYRAAAAAVKRAGLRVALPSRAHPHDIQRFAHRIPENLVVTGVRGLLRMPRILADTQAVAIGQSRHLGGGLLVPVDAPAGMLEAGGTR